jgi:hypothetical protein
MTTDLTFHIFHKIGVVQGCQVTIQADGHFLVLRGVQACSCIVGADPLHEQVPAG